jgi:peptidoglycan/xylan/chitin deacetylase (PgdA/CDA1 family)
MKTEMVLKLKKARFSLLCVLCAALFLLPGCGTGPVPENYEPPPQEVQPREHPRRTPQPRNRRPEQAPARKEAPKHEAPQRKEPGRQQPGHKEEKPGNSGRKLPRGKKVSDAIENDTDVEKSFTLDKNGELNQVTGSLTLDGRKVTVIYDLRNAEEISPAVFNIAYQAKIPSSAGDAKIPPAVYQLVEGNLVWNAKKNSNPACILLSFDDAYFNAWNAAQSELKKNNARVTYFVKGRPDRLLNFAHECSVRGDEFAYHTVDHPDMTKISAAKVKAEAITPLNVFHKADVNVVTFGYPYGFYNEKLNTELLHYYKVLRGYGNHFRLYSADDVRKGFIIAKSLDNVKYPNDKNFYADMEFMLRTAAFVGGGRGLIFPVGTHDIADNAEWGIKPARLEFLLKRVNALGLRFMLYKDYFE